MGRNSRSRTSKTAAGAVRHATELAKKLGRMLRDARMASGLTQSQAAQRAGISQGTWSKLELTGNSRFTLATFDRAGMAVEAPLDAYFRHSSAANAPHDVVHLGNQNLVIRTAAAGGWHSLPEHPIDREVRSSRAADVLLQRGLEYALADIWDWFDDVGAAQRAWHRRLDAVERYAIARMVGDDPLPRVSGIWVVRATQRNTQLINENRHFFRAAFPGSPDAWLRALSEPATPMPAEAALVWVTVKGDRLFASRLA
jgi:transcriptional regulator with XRE-family HTH domain